MILVVMRTLGSVPMNVKNNLKIIDVEISVKMMANIALNLNSQI